MTPPDPVIKWVGSPNFRKIVSTKRGVVFHWIVGYLASADARFTQPNQTATQYGVGPSAIHQYVEDRYRAPGTGHNGANNAYISIEHEAGYLVNGTRFSGAPAMLEKSAELVAFLSRKHGWGKMVPGVNAFGHKEFVATMCPGTLPWHWICERANEINGHPAAPTNPGTVSPASNSGPLYPTGTINGYDIKTIQRAIGAVVDNIWGPNSVAKLKVWQTSVGLESDGIPGPLTWAKINGAPAPAPAAPVFSGLVVDGNWGANTTRRLQQILGVAVDGELGPQTYRALQARLGGLSVDGIFGPASKRRLQTVLGVNADGIIGTQTVRALQTRLNTGRL